MDFYRIIRPFLFALPAETAHDLSQWSLKHGWIPQYKEAYESGLLRQTLWEREFLNPVGLAAGYDKNAELVGPLFSMGFGNIETGTITPRPQPGNPKPRLFRLPKDQAIINRLGFNSKGMEHALPHLKKWQEHFRLRARKPIIGVNIGKNKESTDAVADYLYGLEATYPYADYVTINISSPNTPNLRDLQHGDALSNLMATLRNKHTDLAPSRKRTVPLLVKIAPDLTTEQLDFTLDCLKEHAVDGILISNTTIARPETLKSKHRKQAGGLSGAPLFEPSTEQLRHAATRLKGTIPLIGIGGITSGLDAYQKIRAGASLVQLYTALVYHGPSLPMRICTELAALLIRDGFTSIRDAIGADIPAYRNQTK